MTDPIPQDEIETEMTRSEPKPRDPMANSIWTLGQAVAWIVFRTPEKVREYWNASLVKLSTYEAFADQNEETEQLVSVKTASEELWERLKEGALTASAIKEGTGRPVQIPAHKWAYLELTGDRNLADRLWFTNGYMKVEYRDVTLRRDDICRLWDDASFRAIPANKGGRPPAADWDAYYPKFLEKVKADGVPDKLNVDGWSKLVDVANWLDDLAEKEGYSPGTSTLRAKAREFLAKAKLETGF